jgi:hypothetical protein
MISLRERWLSNDFGILLRRQHAFAKREVQAERLRNLPAPRRQQQFLVRQQLNGATSIWTSDLG